MVKVLLAFSFWGILPIYFKLIQTFTAGEQLLERMFWTTLSLILIVVIRKNSISLVYIIKQRNNRRILITTALLITCNWGVFMRAVLNHKIIDAV